MTSQEGIFIDRPLPPKWYLHAAAFALLAIFTTLISIAPISWDNSWYLHTTVSLIQDGDLDLGEYSHLIENRKDYGVVWVDDQLLNYFPVGPSLFALPWAAPLTWLGHDVYTIYRFSLYIENSLLGFLLFAVFSAFSGNIRISWLLAGVTWFCSPNLVHLTGDYWSHGGTQIALCLMLLLGFGGNCDRWRLARWGMIGLLTAFLYLTRPNSIILAAPFAWFAYRRGWDAFVACGASFSAALIAAMLFFWAQIGAILPPYYGASRLEFGGMAEGLSGQWISPNRGLLIFCPFVLFSLLSIVRSLRTRDQFYLPIALSLIVFSLVVSMFPVWWGGRSYGPRLLTEAIPYLVLLLLPLREEIETSRRIAGLFVLSILLAFAIQFRGITSQEPHAWNDGLRDISRIWLWDDWMVLGE